MQFIFCQIKYERIVVLWVGCDIDIWPDILLIFLLCVFLGYFRVLAFVVLEE